MDKFEYNILEIGHFDLESLNKIGKDGWEIINIFQEQTSQNSISGWTNYKYVVFLKRKIV